MSQPDTTFDIASQEWSPVRWAFHVWSWIAMLALFVLLEAFVDPLTASLALCLKLGWRDFLVAIRLRRHPDRRIAHTIGRYCLAQACFKVAAAGVLVTAVVVACEMWLGVQQNALRYVAGWFLLCCGLVFGELLVLSGTAAVPGQPQLRPWLDGTIYDNLWRPGVPLTCRGTVNRVPWLLWAGMILLSLTFLPGPIAAIACLMLGNPLMIPSGIVFTLFWWLTVRALWTARQRVARAPEECWPVRPMP